MSDTPFGWTLCKTCLLEEAEGESCWNCSQAARIAELERENARLRALEDESVIAIYDRLRRLRSAAEKAADVIRERLGSDGCSCAEGTCDLTRTGHALVAALAALDSALGREGE